MNYTHSKINLNTEHNQVEFVENKFFLWIAKFWQFSLFYGDYLAKLHSKKGVR